MGYQTYTHNRNYGCRITEFILRGHRCVTLENELLRVTVIADKGTDIYEFLHKPSDVDFMWRSWTGLRERAHVVPSSPREMGAHLDYYEGGWQELFPNCGAASFHQGVDIGQHGEVLLLPWDYVISNDDPEYVEVRFNVRTIRTPFHVEKVVGLKRNEAKLQISERIGNEGGQPVDFTWGHHPALGWPFLDESCRVDIPQCRIRTFEEFTPASSRLAPEQSSEWPLALGAKGGVVDISTIPGPEAAASDMVFLDGFSEGWYAITNTRNRLGFALHFPHEIFKNLWYWQVFRGGVDYPWWSATYNVALEPCATLPILSHAVAREEALTLRAGEVKEATLVAVAFTGLDRVTRVSRLGDIDGA